jgi:K+-sensing histidine kinase KdpD
MPYSDTMNNITNTKDSAMSDQDNLENLIYNSDQESDNTTERKSSASPGSASQQYSGPSMNVDEVDSGRALQHILFQYTTRIRQLKNGISSSNRENDHMVDEYIMQNLELVNLNKNLEYKVKERTRELEVANVKLEVMNTNLIDANARLGEQTLQLEQLNEAKEALMHMVVHDLKNPLTAILGTLTLFSRNSFTLPQNIHEMLLGAHANGIKLLSMIEEILMISRMKTKEFNLKLERTNLIQTVFTSVDMMKKTSMHKKLNFVFQPSQQELPLTMDVQLIERVINNLLNNAIKYAPKDSEILVEVTSSEERVMVGVTNWGDPIPKEHHTKIFALFTRVKKEDTQLSGTGIGLAFCKLAVEAHHGTLGIVSPVPPKDNGVCFQFSLPQKPSK